MASPRSGSPGALAALLLGLLPWALAAAPLYLARDESLCDAAGRVCLRGTLSYETHSRVIWLRGRLARADGPGVLRLLLSGTSRPGTVHYATLDVEVRGRLSEILDERMIPDEPGVENWRLDRISFSPRDGG